MSKRLIFGFMLMLCLPMWSQTEPATSADDLTEQQLPWPLGLQHQLDEMMRDPLLDCTQLGIMVWDLTDDRSLFACNQRQLLRPASTMKLLTAITALDQLGSSHELTTALYYKGVISGRTLIGNLYAVGGMDPLFSRDDLASFVASVRRLGIDSISGNIVADVSMKDTLQWGEGWCWDDRNPDLSPLLVGRKALFSQQLADALSGSGVCIQGVGLTTGRLTKGSVLIAERRHGLPMILQQMMKDSDNLFAESVFYQIAASSGQQPARAIDAIRLERALMERAGLTSSRYRLADGSGLSLYNYMSAEAEVLLLRYAYLSQRIYRNLLPTLPVAGVDGTLKKRMKGTPAEGNVQAKTGTVTGISSLAGYLTASNGHRLCFAIINQGVMHSADARDFQDRVCSVLCGQ